MKSMKYFYKMWKGINELSESLLLGILFFILLNLTLQNYEVVGDSMVPNYNQGDRLLLLKFSYLKLSRLIFFHFLRKFKNEC